MTSMFANLFTNRQFDVHAHEDVNEKKKKNSIQFYLYWLGDEEEKEREKE